MGGVSPRHVTDTGRFQPAGPSGLRTNKSCGIGAGLVQLTVEDRTFRCIRALDLADTPEPSEFSQALIDIDSGRTVAYWQYRPTQWDADSADWIKNHPGADLTIDEITYQRRNCTRDEIALTQAVLQIT